MKRFLVSLAFASLPAAGATWYVPGLANISGRNGTHFSSDVKVLNRGAGPALLRVELLPLSGETPPPAAMLSVGPGETFVSENALQSLFGVSETAGTLRVDADTELLIGARTFNDASSAGTYGAALQAIRDRDLLGPDDVGHAPWIAQFADSTRDYRTNIGVFLALPGSEADVVLFDAAGAERGRRTLTGGPRAFQLSVSEVAPGGLPLGRFELQVRAGKATGYTAVVDNVTGDSIVVPALRYTTSFVAIDGVAHAPGREGTYFETDIRLFNSSTSPATVSITPLGLGSALGKTIVLAAKEVKELKDVLGSLFSLPDGSAGALRFTAFGSPVFVLARTSNVNQDGTPGTYGALQLPVPLEALLSPGATGTFIGLRQTPAKPGYRTNIGFLAGQLGGAARLVLRDRNGTVIATNEGDVALAANGWMQPSLAVLFAGVTIPDDAALDVIPTSGSLDSFASIIDNGTGDSVVSSVSPLGPYVCPLPDVWSFFSDPDTLASPGAATLRWYSNADSVRISPGAGTGLPASGSATLTLSGATTYTLEAANACGTSTRTVRVGVGAPLAPTLSVPSTTPGGLVRVTAANVAHPGDVTGVAFAFPDGLTIRADNVFGDGTGGFLAVVPFQPDSAAPGGYRRGACTVSLELGGSTLTPGAAFTIAPLVLPADPVGSFRAWVDQIAGASRQAAVTGIGTLDGGPAAVDVLNQAIDTLVASLHKAADDIAATGSATLPIAEPPPGGPAPPSTTVSRDQLAVFVAVIDAVSASSKAAAASRAGLASIACLKDDPFVKACVYANIAGQQFDPFKLFSNFLTGMIGGYAWAGCAAGVAEVSGIAFADRLNGLISLPNSICPLLPIYLDHFSPRPASIPQDFVSRVALYATLTRLSDQSNLVSQLTQQLAQLAADRYLGGLPKSCGEAIENILGQVVQTLGKFYQPLVDSILSKLNLPGLGAASRDVQVSRCDVIVDSGAPSLVELSSQGCPLQGDPLYCLRGYSPGGVGLLKVTANPLSFLFKDEDRAFRGVRDRAPFPVPISVGPASPAGIADIFSSDGRVHDPDQPLAPGLTVTLSGGGTGPGSWNLEAQQLSPKAWRIRETVKIPATLDGAAFVSHTFGSGQFDGTMTATVDASASLTPPTGTNALYHFRVSGTARVGATRVDYGNPLGFQNGPTSYTLTGATASVPVGPIGTVPGELLNTVSCTIAGVKDTGGPGDCLVKATIEVEFQRVGR